MILLLALGPAQAASLCPASARDLDEASERALMAWNEAEAELFGAARDQVLEGAGCLVEPADPQLAAKVHLVEALDAYARRQPSESIAALRAVPREDLDALATLPVPLVELADEAHQLGPGLEEPVETSRGVSVLVDGRRGAPRPLARAALVQAMDEEGELLWSALLAPGEALPLSTLPEQGPTTLVLEAPDRRIDPSRTLLVSGGAAAVVAGGLWVGAGVGMARFKEMEGRVERGGSLSAAELEDSEELARRTNTLGYSAQAATGLAAVLCATGVVLRF